MSKFLYLKNEYPLETPLGSVLEVGVQADGVSNSCEPEHKSTAHCLTRKRWACQETISKWGQAEQLLERITC
jgi:hypothetical protein